MLNVQSIDAYYGQAKILHGLSLNIQQGEVVALLGRNGAGKSTTMKSIIGIVPPRAGRITFRDREIAGIPTHSISQLGIGYVPEERRIFASLTVLENLEVGRQNAVDGLQPWTHERLFEIFPNLAERRNNLGGDMSGG